MTTLPESPRVVAARLLDDPDLPDGARRMLAQIVVLRRINRADERAIGQIAREAANGWE